jgi:F0F1-type ATP synthase assembly protein I
MRFDYKKHRGWIENVSILMQIGLTMAGCILFCLLIGFYLDRWLGTRGIFVTVFTLLGVIGGAVTVYRQIREILEPKPKDRNEEEDR